jgi:hypothetical protein
MDEWMMNDCLISFYLNDYLRDQKKFLVALFLYDVHFGE